MSLGRTLFKLINALAVFCPGVKIRCNKLLLRKRDKMSARNCHRLPSHTGVVGTILLVTSSSQFIFLSSPEFVVPVISLSNQTIQEGKTNHTILTCVISSGYPKPNITWYKDGVKLSLLALGPVDDCRINGFHYMENQRPPLAKDLVICKPNHVENTGVYKCAAENIKGRDTSEAFLNVLGL